jgi:hypothetical protein
MRKYIVTNKAYGGKIEVEVMAHNEKDAMKRAKVAKTHDISMISNRPECSTIEIQAK